MFLNFEQSPELSLVKFLEMVFSDLIVLCFLMINHVFLFMWSAQPSILTKVTVMLDDHLKALNLWVKDLPRLVSNPSLPILSQFHNICFLKFHTYPEWTTTSDRLMENRWTGRHVGQSVWRKVIKITTSKKLQVEKTSYQGQMQRHVHPKQPQQ